MYVYNDKKLTKEQVDKLAAEKGVEVSVFLTNNPDIQIDEAVVETTESEGKTSTTELDTTVDATEVSEVTESLSEDGSLELEETKYKTPLTLEEKKSLQNNQFSKQMSKEDNFTKERLEELTKEKEDIVSGYDTVIERELGVNEVTDFFGDLYRAGEQGFEQAKAVDPSIDIYRSGAETSDEQIIKWIETNKSIADKSKESEEMQSFNKIYKENGGSWLGFIKGVAKNPSTLSSMLVSSMATQLGSLQSEEVLASAAAGGTAGAAGGSLFAGIGAIPGGLAGAMSGTMTAMETGLTFSELLTEEVGEDIDVEKVRKILENPEKLAELKNKALGRGVAIGAIELATMGLAKGVGGKIAKAGFKGAKPAGIAAAGAVEVVGGGSGEVAGRFVADQEMDIAEIGFEAFAGLGSAPVTMANQLTDLGRNVDIANLNKFLNETNYKEVTEAFSPEVKTSEAQVKMAQSKNAVDIIDKKLKQEVIDGVKTPEEADAVALNFRETQGAVNQIKPLKLSTEDQAIAVQLMKEKKQLSNEIKQVGEPSLTIEQSNRIKEIDNDLKGIGSKAVTQEVEKVKKAAESIKDLDVQEFASTEETEAFLNEQGQDSKASGQQGFIIQNPKTGKQTIVINREIADREIAVAAPSHEFLHALLFQTVKDSPETQLALGNSLKEYINKIDVNKVVKDSNFAKRLEQYKLDPEAVQAEEVLTLFSDAIRTEDIKFNEDIFTKVGDVVRKALQALGVKVKFNNGKDVYNFIKDYNKSLESTGLTKAQVKAAEGVTGALVTDKVQTDEEIIKESRSTVLEAINELVPAEVKTKEEFQNPKVFNPIYKSLINEGGAINNYIRSRTTSVREAEKAIESVSDRLLNFDPEATRKAGETVGAEAFGEFIFANTNFGKMVAKKALFKEGEIAKQETPLDSPEATTQLADEVSIDETKVKSTTSKLRRVLGIKQDDAIYDLAKEVSGEILSGDLPGKKVKTAINKEARKSKLRKAVSNLMGTEKAIDEQFLNKNILEILKALPASDLVKLEREAKVKVLAEQGPRLNVKDAREAVNKGLLPKDTNLQSGPKVSSKLPTTLEQAKEFFTQKRKAGLVNVVTEMLVKDAAPEVTKDKMEPAKRAKVLSEIDRAPTLKFSLSTKQDIVFEENENEDTGHVTFEGEFEVGDTQFALKLIPLDNISDDFEAEFELKKQLEAKNIDTKELLSIEFEDFEDGLDVTGKSLEGKTSAIKTFSIVANSVLDFVKENNIKGVVFNSAEANRTRLYKAMVDRFSKELGWEYKQVKTTPVQGEVDTFVVTPKETAKEQPTVKFSKRAKRFEVSGVDGIKIMRDVANEFDKINKINVEFEGENIKTSNLNPKNEIHKKYVQESIENELWKYFPLEAIDASSVVDYSRSKDRGFYFSKEQWETTLEKAKKNKIKWLDKGNKLDYNIKAVKVAKGIKAPPKKKDYYSSKLFKGKIKDWKIGVKEILQGGANAVKKDPNLSIALFGLFSTQSSSSSHLARNMSVEKGASIAYINSTKSTPTVKEHVEPSNEMTPLMFEAMLFDEVDVLMPVIEAVYYQLGITKVQDDKTLDPTGVFGEAYNYKTTQVKEFNEGLREYFKTGDINKIISPLIRYFNPQVNKNISIDGIPGFNSNEIIIEGKTVAEIYTKQLNKTQQTSDAIFFQNGLIYEVLLNKITKKEATDLLNKYLEVDVLKSKASKSNNNKSAFKYSKAPTNKVTIDTAAKTDEALNVARDLDAPIKKIRVFDFDDTLAQTKSDVLYTMPDGTEGKLNAEQFANDGSTLLSEGAVFDFSEFNKVTEGKKGPLFKVAQTIAAKRGTEDVFVLTARAPESQLAIYEFLKSQGLNIPLKNITGLGNSTGDAKARWIVDKAADGYNDFYFADDAPQNVKAVRDALSVIDVKSKTQQAKIKFSKSLDLNKDFNDIIENKTGIASDKTYARVKAEVAGANKGKFNFFIPPSAEDFVGLLYSTLGKGSTGDAQMAWYKAHLLNPFARAMENLANDRANMMQDFRGLKKALKIVPKNLRKKIKDSNFTQEQAVRAYIWDKQGMEIPGLSNKDQKNLVDFVNADANLTTFANQLIAINKGDEYAAPDAGWVAGTIGTDFIKALNTTKRSKYLEVWQQNVDQIFSEANLNKLEAAYGANYKEAMVDMLKRMETGRNTSSGSDRLAGRFTDWLTNSVGAIMFFNTRSAVLQTISAVNFINFSDNNVLKAGQAFANQPQYWKDFKKLFNSPFLLDRRSGLKLNVNEADIAAMAKGPGNSARNVIAGILKAGFLPTQLADSFAIASGGASFYRNRIKALQKEGLTEAEAEEVAFRDFREIAEESQQSSRPDKISQQQAGPLGRVVLAFANTPAQYARLIKKAASDLKNGRGDAKTNISKIIYYGVAQNLLFSALQQALFAIAFDDDEEEEKKNEKYFNIINGMSDSILRGIGVGGAIVSVVKNTAIRLAKEADKKSPKYQDAVVKGVLQISPPVSSKVGKLQSAGRSFSWNQEEMRTRGWSIDNPAYLASANVISAATNVPLDRAVKKITNIVDAGNEDIEYYKRVALALGWSAWELGIDKKGGKVAPPKTNMDKLYDLNKKEQIDSLLSLGLNKKQIKLLKKEEDRVKAILNPKSIKQIKVSKRDSLFGLNKKDQVKALEKLGLTKKEIRALRLESDRVEAIINKQKQKN